MNAPATTRHAQPGWIPQAGSFAARLALLRHQMGWSNVKEAALACGLPIESWRSWEKDGRQPRNLLRVVSTISTVSGVDYYWLLDGSVMPNATTGLSAWDIRTSTRSARIPRRPESVEDSECAWRDSNSQPSDP